MDNISTHSKLRFYAFKGLLLEWTPEQIPGRLKELHSNNPLMNISHESIYKYIYLVPQTGLKKYQTQHQL